MEFMVLQNDNNSNFKDHLSQITATNIKILKKSLKCCKNYQNLGQRHEASKCCWKNGIDRLAQYKITTNPQFVKTQYL